MNENKHETGKLRGFARNHPLLAIAATGGLGLLAGPELAAGIVVGAAVDALIRRQNAQTERTRTLLDRVPATVRSRARAVYAAARGKEPSNVDARTSSEAQPIPTGTH